MSDTLQQCRAFLGAIFEPGDIIEFRNIHPTTEERKQLWGTLADLPRIVPKLARLNAAGWQCYMGGNPRKASGGAKEGDVALARCHFADFDGTTVDEALGRVEAAVLPVPTVTLSTGGGVHVWWRLTEPVADLAEWRARQQSLNAALESDPRIQDPPRIMRLPGFVNTKDDYAHMDPPPVSAIVAIDPSRRYPVQALNVAAPTAPAVKAALVSVEPPPAGTAGANLIERAERYIDRMPEAVSGQGGHGKTYAVAAALVNGFGLDEETAYAIMAQRYNPRCRPEWSERELRHKVSDAATKEHERARGYLRDEPPPMAHAPEVDVSAIEASNGKPPADSKPAKPKRKPVEPYTPFPTHLLPEPLREFVEATAAAMRCDASYAALPLLAVVASAIGTTRQLRLKRSWSVLPILWTATIGESGTLKTPPFKAAMRALRDRQGRALEEYEKAKQQYLTDYELYDKAKAVWKRSKDPMELPPDEPTPPVSVRYMVSDCTVESLAPILLDNPRGVLMARDELAGWFGSFDKYSGGGKAGSADAAHWLSMHNAESITVDRKTGAHRTTYVPMAAASLTGGIQPKILCRALGQDRREDGMLARLLVACPPRRPKRWSEDDVPERLEKAIARLLDRLHELEHETDEEDHLRPGTVGLEPEAKRVWVSFYNAHADEQADMAGDLAAAWSKLEEYAPRLALVIHFTRWAAFDTTLADEWKVDAVSMRAGIELVEWFKREAKRVYSMLGEDDEDRERRRLAEWIERKGGETTPGDVARGCRWLKEPGMADAALEDLRTAGWGQWVVEPTATKPKRVFRLSTASTSTDSTETRDVGESVDVDTVDAPNIEPESAVSVPGDDDQWGEL